MKASRELSPDTCAATPKSAAPEAEAPNYPAINLQYRLDMAAAAFRAILRSDDSGEIEAFAKAGLDYSAGDIEALAEGAAFADAPVEASPPSSERASPRDEQQSKPTEA